MSGIERLEDRQLFAAIVGTELRIDGGAGNDVIKVTQSDAATLRVEQNGAVSFFNDANVSSIKIRGFGGNDRLEVISTGDRPLTEAVKIEAGGGNDTLRGGDGNDTVEAGAGNDYVYGGKGNDRLVDGDGNDTLFGNDGDDTFVNGNHSDAFDGGAGVDTVDYAARTIPVLVTLDGVANDGGFFFASENDNCKTTIENLIGGSDADVLTAQSTDVANVFNGNGGNDQLITKGGNDKAYGGAGNDTIVAGAGNDILGGELGDDLLLAGKGNDTVHGNDGDDVISGGAGADNLWGDSGNDVLIAADGAKDVWVDGGLGYDFGDLDDNDPNSSVESVA